jgi:hypothetical protein
LLLHGGVASSGRHACTHAPRALCVRAVPAPCAALPCNRQTAPPSCSCTWRARW